MLPVDLVDALLDLGLPVLLVLAIAYVLLFPEKAQLVAGWLWGLFARIARVADKRAVAARVEGRINGARKALLKSIPDGVWEGKLKLRWTNAEEAESVLRQGEVLVCMRRSEHEEENIANGLMAYLPKAVVPRARRYIDPTTMRACDLVLAKAILDENDGPNGALHALFECHLDPARQENDALSAKIDQIDELDLSGWLLRVLLPEYRRLGDALYPSTAHSTCADDAEEMRVWLCGLASCSPGETGRSLSYPGRFFRVAIIFVAQRDRLEREGLKPYRRRAKRYLYNDQYDAIYFMARDHNIEAVEQLLTDLESDGRIASIEANRYVLRRDFKAKKLDRETAIVACVRRRRGPGEIAMIDDTEDLPSETYEFDRVEGRPERAA